MRRTVSGDSILTGAPGRPVGDVARSQILNQIRPLPNGEIIMKHDDQAIAQFLENGTVVMDRSFPEGLKILLRALENPSNMPFARELMVIQPSRAHRQGPEPML